MTIDIYFHFGLEKLVNFYLTPEIQKSSYDALKRNRTVHLWLTILTRLLPRLVFVFLLVTFWIMLDTSYKEIYSRGNSLALLPTKNNKKVFSRVFDAAGIPLQDFDKERVSFLARIYALVVHINFLIKNLRRINTHDIGTLLQLTRYTAAYFVFCEIKTCRLSIVANDHSPVCVAFTESCRSKGAETLYVQHGSISGLFPPLSFDFAITFNRKSVGIYEGMKPEKSDTQFLILSPFRDDFFGIKSSTDIAVVCISLGVAPNFLVLRDLIKKISKTSPLLRFLFRPHPRIDNDEFERFLTSGGFDFENVFTGDDWSGVDMHLAGNSGVHLDALHSGVPSFYLGEIDSIIYDYYGFIRDGIILPFSTEFLSKPSSARYFYDHFWVRAYGYYDETVMTPIAEQEGRIRCFIQRLQTNIECDT